MTTENEIPDALLRGALDAMRDPFLVCASTRTDDGTIAGFRVLFANRAAELFMGEVPDSLTDRPAPDEIPYLETMPFFETFRRVVETGEAWVADAIEFEAPVAGGGLRRGLIDIQAARVGDGFSMTFHDVSAREQERRERDHLAAALDQATDGVIVVDLNGTVTYANPVFLASRGLAGHEILGRDALELGGAVLGHDGLAAVPEAISSGIPWRSNIDYTAPDGTIHSLEVTASPVRDRTGSVTSVVVTSRDVTERIQALEALEASEERLRTAMEAMLDGVTVLSAVRDGEGRIVDFRLEYANAAISRLSGIAVADQAGHTLLELFPAHRTNGLLEAYVGVVETGVPFESGSFRYVDPDAAGGPIDQVVEHRAARLGDGYVLSVRDVTARAAAEDEVRRLNEELEQRVRDRTAKLEAANRELETFSYSVSHDLRSPLRAVTGFAEILNRRYRERLDPKGRHYLDNIVEGGLHMGVLIDNLLAYSRLGRSRVHNEPVPLGPILQRLRTTLADQISADDGLLAVAEPMAVPVGDPTLIEQILVNLLNNAVTYRRPEVPLRITVSAVLVGRKVTLEVADNGIGIAPEYQARILEPFVRLHTAEEYPGTGIGLATVRKAARLMGTDVTVSSAVGVGSTFTVTLAAAPSAPVRP